jgi:hypothetical protein
MLMEALQSRLKVIEDDILRLAKLASETPKKFSRITTCVWPRIFSARREGYARK